MALNNYQSFVPLVMSVVLIYLLITVKQVVYALVSFSNMSCEYQIVQAIFPHYVPSKFELTVYDSTCK